MASDPNTQRDTATKERLDRPRRYKVLLHNDDYTSMEFVVWLLQGVFQHSPAAATRVMLQIHKVGIGVAGVYSRDVAETRVAQVRELAEDEGHPLQCTMEPE